MGPEITDVTNRVPYRQKQFQETKRAPGLLPVTFRGFLLLLRSLPLFACLSKSSSFWWVIYCSIIDVVYIIYGSILAVRWGWFVRGFVVLQEFTIVCKMI